VVVAGRCWPGNRNDVIAARHTVAHLLTGHEIRGDRGYRGVPSITTPRRDTTDRVIGDDHYRAHRRIRARSNTSSPVSKTGNNCGHAAAAAPPSATAVKSSPDTGPKTRNQLRVN
jgi:hypothetical protein